MTQNDNLTPNKRIIWIDNLKAISIIFVVLVHVLMFLITDAPKFYNKYIVSFLLPLLLFVSGYLFNVKKFPNFRFFIKKRFRSLIVPYFTFAFIALLVLFTFKYFNVHYLIFKHFNIYDFGYETNGLNTILIPIGDILYSRIDNINGPTWFITFLFIVEIYFYFLKINIKSTKVMLFVLFISSIIGYLYSLFINFKLPWHIEVALIGVVFYGIGNIYKEQTDYFSNKILEKRYLTIFFLIVLLTINILFAFLNDSVGFLPNKYGNYVFFFIASFSGIFFYLLISKIIGSHIFLSFLGKNTIIILCIHSFFIAILSLLTYNYLNPYFLNSSIASICLAIIYTFIIIISMIPFIIVINRYFPFLIGKSKIG